MAGRADTGGRLICPNGCEADWTYWESVPTRRSVHVSSTGEILVSSDAKVEWETAEPGVGEFWCQGCDYQVGEHAVTFDWD